MGSSSRSAQVSYVGVYKGWMNANRKLNRDSTIPIELLLTGLRFSEVLSKFEHQLVDAEKTDDKKLLKLFTEIMPDKGQQGFNQVVDILKENKYIELANDLNGKLTDFTRIAVSRLGQLIALGCQKIAEDKNGRPSWYQLPRHETVIDKSLCLKRVEIGQANSEAKDKTQKVVLMVGATGAGKSTLINGMVNYLYGVKKDDPFRVQLIPKESDKSQAHSQTSEVTQYILHWQPGSPVPYNVVFIDTPGFGDSRGIQQDDQLIKQLRAFFNTAIDHIDAVGFVMPSTQSRLMQKYIFDCMLSLFGKDMEKSFFLMVTFADASTPSELSAVQEEFVIHYDSYFKFNNSIFTMESNQGEQVELTDDVVQFNAIWFWNMAYTAYGNFFNKLGVTTAKSLTLTREVLEERQRLENTIDALTLSINDGVNQLCAMTEELPFIIEYEAEKDANKGYTRSVEVPEIRKVVFHDGHFVTNCSICSQTCHDPCGIPNDDGKAECDAMGPDGYCKVCKNRCKWDLHFHKNFVFESYIARQNITVDDMKRKYMDANSKLSLKENLLLGHGKEYDKVQKDVLEAVEMIRKCLERLTEIAMQPNPLSAVQYIDLLIKATERDKQPGWQQRLTQLQNARDRASLIQDMLDQGKQYDPFAKLKEDIKMKASENKGLIEKVLSLFGGGK